MKRMHMMMPLQHAVQCTQVNWLMFIDAMKIIMKPYCEVPQDIEQTFFLFIKLGQCVMILFFFFYFYLQNHTIYVFKTYCSVLEAIFNTLVDTTFF